MNHILYFASSPKHLHQTERLRAVAHKNFVLGSALVGSGWDGGGWYVWCSWYGSFGSCGWWLVVAPAPRVLTALESF